MKTLQINGKEFQLSKELLAFLKEYVARIEAYVAKNQIDADLHQDILQRLSDKLTEQEQKGGLEPKKVIQIVNDLGEPEEIFADEVLDFEEIKSSKKQVEKADSAQRSLPFYVRLQKAKRSRPQEGAMIWGVCKMLEQLTGWNVWIWRAIFLGQFVFGFSLLLPLSFSGYLLCALVFPRKEKEYGKKSVFHYFFKQIFDLFLAIPNFFSACFNGIKAIFSAVWPTTGNILVRLFKLFCWLIRTGILLIGSGFLTVSIITLGVFLYFLIVGFEQHGLDYALLFPAITRRGVLSGMIFLAILLLGGISLLLRKKLFPKIMRYFVVGTGLFAGIALVATVTNLLTHYGYGGFVHKEVIELSKPQDPKNFRINLQSIKKDTSLFADQGIDFLRGRHPVSLHPTFDGTFKAEYTYKFTLVNNRAGEKRFKKLTDHLIKPSQQWEGKQLSLGYFSSLLFDELLPVVPLRYEIDLYVPVEYQFELLQDGFSHPHILELADPRWPSGFGYPVYCASAIFYDQKLEKFTCERLMTERDQKRLVERELGAQADMLMPLLGKNADRKLDGNFHDSYWKLHSVNWIAEKSAIVKYADQFFNFWLLLEREIDEEYQVKFRVLELKDLEQKGRMNEERMQYYQGWEKLPQFRIKMQDEKQELLLKIEELKRQLEELEKEEIRFG